MELDWDASMKEITDDTTLEELEKVVKETQTAVDKTLDDSERFIDDKSVPNPGTGTSSAGQAKIDDTLRPKDTLLRSFNLEEANLWFQKFTAYFTHNEKALRGQGLVVRRQLLDNCIEAGLASALRTDDKIKDETPVIGDENSCLSRLKEIFLERNPLFLRRYRFQECRQEQGESVTEWWIRKKAKACECELDKITKDDVMLLELIRGVRDNKLKEEFLKQKEPDLAQLVQIAERWQTASHVAKNMGMTTVSVQKTSNYKAGKSAKWQESQSRSQGPSGNEPEKCQWCGGDKKHHNDKQSCPANGKECYECHRMGHFGSVCRSKGKPQRDRGRSRSQSRGRKGNKSKAQSVRVYSTRVKDDSEPTPLMSKVSIIPHTVTPFKFDVLPNTGCYQSLITMDLVSANSMVVDRYDKRMLKTVSGNQMDCSGSVTFEVEYEGRKTDVLALVSSSIQEEILLSWQVMQRLGVISKDFPHIGVRACGVRSSGDEALAQREEKVK